MERGDFFSKVTGKRPITPLKTSSLFLNILLKLYIMCFDILSFKISSDQRTSFTGCF